MSHPPLKKNNIDTLQGSCSSLSQEAVSCFQDSQCTHAALPWPRTGLFHPENVAEAFGDCCSFDGPYRTVASEPSISRFALG